jgi:hypothetical protein
LTITAELAAPARKDSRARRSGEASGVGDGHRASGIGQR